MTPNLQNIKYKDVVAKSVMLYETMFDDVGKYYYDQ